MKAKLSGFLAAWVALVFLSPASGEEPKVAESADWPQWRGVNRDGASLGGPSLLNKWPEGGPKLLWRSERIPGELSGWHQPSTIGGCGSVTVSGGRVLISDSSWHVVNDGKVVVSTEMLNDWGWYEGVPDDLARKVEEARKSKKQPLAGAAQEAYVKEFINTLDPGQGKEFSAYIMTRLKGGQFSWEFLSSLSKVRNQKFDNVGALAKAANVSVHPHTEGKYLVTPVNATASKFFDLNLCLDADTGKVLWKTEEFPGGMTGSENRMYGASGTPAVVDGKCYVAGSAGVYCVSMADGKTIWKAKARFTNSSPLVRDGQVYVCFWDGLVAYDAKTGEIRWVQPEVRTVDCSVSPWIDNGKTRLLVGTPLPARKAFGLACVDAKTGAILWQCSVPFNYSTPAVLGDMAVTFNKANITAVRLSSEKGELAWTSKEGYDERGGSVTVLNGYVYAVGGGYRNSGAHCYDLQTGELKWTQSYGHTETSSAVSADGKVFAYAVKMEGTRKVRGVVMFKASPEKYEELGFLTEAHLGDAFSIFSSPTICGGKMYLRMATAIACYDLTETGK